MFFLGDPTSREEDERAGSLVVFVVFAHGNVRDAEGKNSSICPVSGGVGWGGVGWGGVGWGGVGWGGVGWGGVGGVGWVGWGGVGWGGVGWGGVGWGGRAGGWWVGGGGKSARSALDFELYSPPAAARACRKPRAAGARFLPRVGVCAGLARAGPLSFDTSKGECLSTCLPCRVACASPHQTGAGQATTDGWNAADG